MQNNGLFDFLKLRGSWGGKLGNDKVPGSEGAITSTVVTTAFGDTMVNGVNTTSNFTSLKWEVTEEINAGISARTFNNKLSLEADYYVRDTKDAVIPIEVPLIPDATRQNVGEIRNQGFELALNWSDQVSEDFSYSVGANFATLNNEVLDTDREPYIDTGSAEFRQRTRVGDPPVFSFFGLEVDGVYQNQAQIDADPSAQFEIANGRAIVPGDLKFKDQDGVEGITADDRVMLGNYLPTYSFGFNLGFNYKAWDFSAAAWDKEETASSTVNGARSFSPTIPIGTVILPSTAGMVKVPLTATLLLLVSEKVGISN